MSLIIILLYLSYPNNLTISSFDKKMLIQLYPNTKQFSAFTSTSTFISTFTFKEVLILKS